MHILIFFNTAQYGPGGFEYRGTAGTYTYSGFVGTWSGNEEKLTLYASQQVRATKIVVTYESAEANFVSQPMITGDIDFADTANVIITAEEDISGKLIISALENIDTTVAPAKVIKNGQLIITKDGVEYNAQGAVAK